ncbi:hypothetical protein SG34_024130 [Thalassomonas viridans]|uniref:Uncharacterized protein n=1 Tax=Thalassomonas viridans TaxID=137584 RepID=A0AAF0C8I3_9GAMM|nr:ABC transporter permease [Thalassomonas viridans]WDE04396.1 hypothetical protein SG34_024130 [Thalassomonas viridans]
MSIKLFLDLSVSWGKHTCQNVRFLLVMLLLSLPVTILIHFNLIENSYLSPDFAGLKANSQIYNALVFEDNKTQALESYLTDELASKWPKLKASYERTTTLEVVSNNDKQVLDISFFSGGYELLAIKPLIGSLSALEFPVTGNKLVAAVSYSHWQHYYSGSHEVVGSQVLINQQVVTIVAVMPQDFTSFRKNKEVQMVMPYNQLSELLDISRDNITPDTFSYLLGDIHDTDDFAQTLSKHFKDEILILDDSQIILNKAIGVDSQEYLTISKRIALLKALFVVLLLFCFIAFITFYSGENTRKQQEYQVRSLCGASHKHLFLQRSLDIFYTVFTITLFCLILFPITQDIIHLVLPQLNSNKTNWSPSQLFKIAFVAMVLLWILMVLIFFIQDKLITTHIGRGQSASFSQKLQSYLLLSLLLGLTSIAIYSSILLYKSQEILYKTSPGFEAEDRYVVTFDFPRFTQQTIMANQSALLLIQQLNATAGIEQAALTNIPPLSGRTSFSRWYSVTNQPIGTGTKSNTLTDSISPGYFNALGNNILLGNSLTWQDPMQIVVNETLWNGYFKGQKLANAKLLQVNTLNNAKIVYQVVGVVDDIYLQGPDRQPEPMVFKLSLALIGIESIIIKSSLSQEKLKNLISHQLENVNVNFSNIKVTSLSKLVAQEHAPRLAILTVSILSTGILLLSAIVFCLSTINQLSEKNARELAVRFCSGARPLQLVKGEYLFFLSSFIPVFVLLVAICSHFSTLLTAHLINIELINPVLISAIVISHILLLLPILHYKLMQKTRSSWTYLS